MNKGMRAALISVIAVIVALIIILVVLVSGFVFVDWSAYPKNKDLLDLTAKPLSAASFDKLHSAMPNTKILWQVPMDTGVVRSDVKEITLTGLSDNDLHMLDYLTDLQTVHAEECTDAPRLAQLQQRHPDWEVLYSVTLGGQEFAPDSGAVSVSGLTEQDIPALCSMGNLTELTITGGTDLALVKQLQTEHPEWNVAYLVTIGDEVFSGETREILLEDAAYADVSAGVASLPELERVMLINPKATASELTELRASYPNVDIHWQIEAYGMTLGDDTVEMDISGIEVGSVEEVAAYADCLPKLEKLIMSDCGIDNETMAAFRESKRDSYKVVWTVHFTQKLSVRTDATTLMPGHDDIREYRFNESTGVNVQDLKYFEDMVCMDLGHFIIYKIDFVAYMPHLKYLILSWDPVNDISPISNCKELIYLELDYSQVRDFTPLLECTALEDLNVCGTVAKVDPLTQMKWLKNLWASNRSGSAKRILTEAFEEEEGITLYTGGGSSRAWRHLPHYYDQRDMLGMYYMNQ